MQQQQQQKHLVGSGATNNTMGRVNFLQLPASCNAEGSSRWRWRFQTQQQRHQHGDSDSGEGEDGGVFYNVQRVEDDGKETDIMYVAKTIGNEMLHYEVTPRYPNSRSSINDELSSATGSRSSSSNDICEEPLPLYFIRNAGKRRIGPVCESVTEKERTHFSTESVRKADITPPTEPLQVEIISKRTSYIGLHVFQEQNEIVAHVEEEKHSSDDSDYREQREGDTPMVPSFVYYSAPRRGQHTSESEEYATEFDESCAPATNNEHHHASPLKPTLIKKRCYIPVPSPPERHTKVSMSYHTSIQSATPPSEITSPLQVSFIRSKLCGNYRSEAEAQLPMSIEAIKGAFQRSDKSAKATLPPSMRRQARECKPQRQQQSECFRERREVSSSSSEDEYNGVMIPAKEGRRNAHTFKKVNTVREQEHKNGGLKEEQQMRESDIQKNRAQQVVFGYMPKQKHKHTEVHEACDEQMPVSVCGILEQPLSMAHVFDSLMKDAEVHEACDEQMPVSVCGILEQPLSMAHVFDSLMKDAEVHEACDEQMPVNVCGILEQPLSMAHVFDSLMKDAEVHEACDEQMPVNVCGILEQPLSMAHVFDSLMKDAEVHEACDEQMPVNVCGILEQPLSMAHVFDSLMKDAKVHEACDEQMPVNVCGILEQPLSMAHVFDSLMKDAEVHEACDEQMPVNVCGILEQPLSMAHVFDSLMKDAEVHEACDEQMPVSVCGILEQPLSMAHVFDSLMKDAEVHEACDEQMPVNVCGILEQPLSMAHVFNSLMKDAKVHEACDEQMPVNVCGILEQPLSMAHVFNSLMKDAKVHEACDEKTILLVVRETNVVVHQLCAERELSPLLRFGRYLKSVIGTVCGVVGGVVGLGTLSPHLFKGFVVEGKKPSCLIPTVSGYPFKKCSYLLKESLMVVVLMDAEGRQVLTKHFVLKSGSLGLFKELSVMADEDAASRQDRVLNVSRRLRNAVKLIGGIEGCVSVADSPQNPGRLRLQVMPRHVRTSKLISLWEVSVIPNIIITEIASKPDLFLFSLSGGIAHYSMKVPRVACRGDTRNMSWIYEKGEIQTDALDKLSVRRCRHRPNCGDGLSTHCLTVEAVQNLMHGEMVEVGLEHLSGSKGETSRQECGNSLTNGRGRPTSSVAISAVPDVRESAIDDQVMRVVPWSPSAFVRDPIVSRDRRVLGHSDAPRLSPSLGSLSLAAGESDQQPAHRALVRLGPLSSAKQETRTNENRVGALQVAGDDTSLNGLYERKRLGLLDFVRAGRPDAPKTKVLSDRTQSGSDSPQGMGVRLPRTAVARQFLPDRTYGGVESAIFGCDVSQRPGDFEKREQQCQKSLSDIIPITQREAEELGGERHFIERILGKASRLSQRNVTVREVEADEVAMELIFQSEDLSQAYKCQVSLLAKAYLEEVEAAAVRRVIELSRGSPRADTLQHALAVREGRRMQLSEKAANEMKAGTAIHNGPIDRANPRGVPQPWAHLCHHDLVADGNAQAIAAACRGAQHFGTKMFAYICELSKQKEEKNESI
ncbi:hypothetical protein, conserved, (fragment), partial [Trypanosoma brucei gambiense DAL972]